MLALLYPPGIGLFECGYEAQSGLACYCCMARCNDYSLVAPCNCKAHGQDSAGAVWSFEALPGGYSDVIKLVAFYSPMDSSVPPETVYLQPPVKPPQYL